jgi:acid phosphatase family membrane protein YuiD
MVYNPYIVIPFATWLIAQTIKFVNAALRGNLDLKYLYASGGMPSVHSAVVCSLAVTALLVDGYNSSIFGLTAVFAVVVMYDSFGVRRASGDHAAALNMIINSLGHDHIRLKAPGLRLREILGHKPAEVTIGALIGIMLGLLFNIDKLEKQLDWLRVRPEAIEFYVYGAIFAALAIGGLAFRLIVRFRYRKSRPMVRLAKHILIKTQLIGWLGLLFSLAQLQRLNYYSWRAWPILLLVALLTWDSWLLKRFYRQLPADLALDKANAERQSWLEPKKKRKKRK